MELVQKAVELYMVHIFCRPTGVRPTIRTAVVVIRAIERLKLQWSGSALQTKSYRLKLIATEVDTKPSASTKHSPDDCFLSSGL